MSKNSLDGLCIEEGATATVDDVREFLCGTARAVPVYVIGRDADGRVTRYRITLLTYGREPETIHLHVKPEPPRPTYELPPWQPVRRLH